VNWSDLDDLAMLVIAVSFIVGLGITPYLAFKRAAVSMKFCMGLAVAEALSLAGWYVFSAAIVTPLTRQIVIEGLLAGSILAIVTFGVWILSMRMKGLHFG
jgi:uncharacterized membrane protein